MRKKEIKVLNAVYELNNDDNSTMSDEFKGHCSFEKKRIDLYDKSEETLIHELIHAYLWEMGHFENGGFHTENNVMIIERVMHNMLLDNNITIIENKNEENNEESSN